MKVDLHQGVPVSDYVSGLGTVTLVWQTVNSIKLYIEDEPEVGTTIRKHLEKYIADKEERLAQERRELGYFKEVLEALPPDGES
jgi:hypothetical protein